jgi:cell division septal protein FtsQ
MKQRSSVRLKDKRRRRGYVTFAGAVLFVSLVVGGIAYGTRLPQFSVREVTIEGAVRADRARVEAAVQNELSGSYLGVIPKRFIYTLPRGSLSAALLASFPQIGSVVVAREGDRGARVVVAERAPEARACASGSCFVLDAYGFVFDTAEGAPDVRTYHTERLALGETYLGGAFQDTNALMTRLAEATRSEIQTVTIKANGDVFAVLSRGGELRFRQDTDHARLVEDVRGIFDSDALTSARALEYLDLRFGEKVVAKFRE